MLARLLPRDEKFFELFDQLAGHLASTAKLLDALFSDAPAVIAHVKAIKDIEHKADLLTTTVNQRIDKSFITPIDREDIHLLASRLDDVIDLIDGNARRAQIFHVGAAPTGVILMAETIQKCNEQVLVAVKGLAEDKSAAVIAACVHVKRLEEEGDSLYHEWMGKLFEGTPDPLSVIKWKEIYDNLEKTLDYAEDAANVLESISLKHS